MKVIASLTVAAALAVAGSASAQEARIVWGDLNMATGPGADAFDARVDVAARSLCRGVKRPGSFISDRSYCRTAVQSEALRQLPGRVQVEYAMSRRAVVL